MTVAEVALLTVAGFAAGLIGSIAGLASLFSYPALLATGIPPVTANVTNTVALVLTGVGSVSASRPELTGQRDRLVRLGAAGVLGGATGAVLLLLTPAGAFERVVPFLIAGASLLLLVQRRPAELAADGAQLRAERPHRDHWVVLPVTFLVSIYGGYFGAAAGTMMLAVYLLTTGEGLARSNALRNAVLGLANGVAAVGYAVFADVAWLAALPLAVGLFAGGRLGPRVVRRAPQTLLRRVIAVAGLGLALHLGLDAFG
ncbi:sulfite exporter TauE/SafE family protein [Modestobacter italicus]|uniref:sulfite exporter TauE/SafE family protein n=1 Tax=Modestobacter italicus (strain DSM 44449 / CECT 9708 / BC 501) TaxID=2732864 RepID=UPI001C9615E1|nr:sulfite exporter TauE/SafE family protein [Modestobacter italicus]